MAVSIFATRSELSVGPKPPGARRVVVLGASLVQGTISASFVDELRRLLGDGWDVVNAGRNGELAWNALQRVDEVVRCMPDRVVVLVGSNDVMASLDQRQERRYRRFMKLPQAPTLAWYRENMERIVDALRARADIFLCSLPFLGEDLGAAVNERVRAYNDAVRAVAQERGATFVDVHAALVAELEARGGGGRAFPRTLGPMLRAALARAVLRWPFDRIGRSNGFVLLSDGIHLGERGASVVARTIAAALRA